MWVITTRKTFFWNIFSCFLILFERDIGTELSVWILVGGMLDSSSVRIRGVLELERDLSRSVSLLRLLIFPFRISSIISRSEVFFDLDLESIRVEAGVCAYTGSYKYKRSRSWSWLFDRDWEDGRILLERCLDFDEALILVVEVVEDIETRQVVMKGWLVA